MLAKIIDPRKDVNLNDLNANQKWAMLFNLVGNLNNQVLQLSQIFYNSLPCAECGRIPTSLVTCNDCMTKKAEEENKRQADESMAKLNPDN